MTDRFSPKPFMLEQLKEALGDRVIAAVTTATHAVGLSDLVRQSVLTHRTGARSFGEIRDALQFAGRAKQRPPLVLLNQER